MWRKNYEKIPYIFLVNDTSHNSNFPSMRLKGTLAWDFFVFTFCTYRTHIGQTIRLLNFFDFVLEFTDLFKFFLHSVVTQLTRSLIPHQLSQCGVRLHVNWVNAEWDSMSTESMWNDKIFVNVCVFCVDSVGVESHSALTQLTESLTPGRLSVREMNQAKKAIYNQLWRL
jgi:hypothetical protein